MLKFLLKKHYPINSNLLLSVGNLNSSTQLKIFLYFNIYNLPSIILNNFHIYFVVSNLYSTISSKFKL